MTWLAVALIAVIAFRAMTADAVGSGESTFVPGGQSATVSGGNTRSATGLNNWVAGGLFENS